MGASSDTKHYNDTLTLRFDPERKQKRYCDANTGEKYRAVSAVLDKVLAKELKYWAAKCGADFMFNELEEGETLTLERITQVANGTVRAHKVISDASAAKGHIVHDWLHQMVRNNLQPVPHDQQLADACFEAAQWFLIHAWKLVLAERPLCSRKLKLAGTPDAIGYLDGKLTIIDWKTGKQLWFAHLIQTAFYALMYEEEFNEPIQRIVLVNASVENPFKVYTVKSRKQVKHLMSMARLVYRLAASMGVYDKQLRKGDK